MVLPLTTMKKRRLRLTIRIQLTIIVVLAALLGTGATLLVANFTIQSYLQGQLATQARQSLNVAFLIMRTVYGAQFTIDADSQLIAQAPQSASPNPTPQGAIVLNGNFDYPDQVAQLVGGTVTIYQCAGPGRAFFPCRVATTNTPGASGGPALGVISLNTPLDPTINTIVARQQAPYVTLTSIQATPYMAAYGPITDSQGRLIAILSVAIPLNSIQSLIARNTSHLILAESAVMVLSIVIALLIARAITLELQRASRQVAAASASFTSIATQQASGSEQQVWAVHAVNHALTNLGETTSQITQRTEQLAQMGTSALANWETLTTEQLQGFIAYIARSMHDISSVTQHQAKTYARMSSAMRAVKDVTGQVARASHDTAENAQRLEQVVLALQDLLGSSATAPTASVPAATQDNSRRSPGSIATLARSRETSSDGRLPSAAPVSSPLSGNSPPAREDG
jgi:hypothetical protein